MVSQPASDSGPVRSAPSLRRRDEPQLAGFVRLFFKTAIAWELSEDLHRACVMIPLVAF